MMLQARPTGQSMVEFTLAMPILIFVILVLVNLGRILFTYAQANNAIREAARLAEVSGYENEAAYLDCDRMKDAAEQIYFANAARLTIVYQKANNAALYNCDINPPQEADLVNGDMLQLSLQVSMEFIAMPLGEFTMRFRAQRTLLKSINLGSECPATADPDDCDLDYDGLRDGWERQYFGYTSYFNATDDPDQDGCNNGCEEQHSLNAAPPEGHPLDPNLPYPAGGEAVSVSAPLAPSGLTATVVCSTGKVSFSWQPLSPVPARAQIKDADTHATVVDIDSVAPGLLTQAYCPDCDTLPINGTGQRRYYMVSYNGTAPTEVRGPNSNITSVNCLNNAAVPLNFMAATACDGNVDFNWQWNPAGGVPVRLRIFRSDTDALVREMTITSPATTTCDNCDSWDTPAFNRTYYAVAYNAADFTYASAPSEVSEVRCDNTTARFATITGTLWLDIDQSGGEKASNDRWLQTPTGVLINLRGLDANNSSINLSIGSNITGQFTFVNLLPGSYLLTLPASLEGREQLASVSGDLPQATLTSNTLNLTITGAETIHLNFRYVRGRQN